MALDIPPCALARKHCDNDHGGGMACARCMCLCGPKPAVELYDQAKIAWVKSSQTKLIAGQVTAKLPVGHVLTEYLGGSMSYSPHGHASYAVDYKAKGFEPVHMTIDLNADTRTATLISGKLLCAVQMDNDPGWADRAAAWLSSLELTPQK